MKRSEIKVGEVYGVRKSSREHETVVAARVVAIDVPYTYAIGRYGGRESTAESGGIEVEFIEPTRVHAYSGFSLAAKSNENAGPVTARYTFGDKQGGGHVGRHFVGVWAVLEAGRKAAERAKRERVKSQREAADSFAPVLAEYREKLARVGIPTEVYGDGSGLHAANFSTGLRRTTDGRPTGFSFDVRIGKDQFDRLIEIAARHGESITETS